MESRGRVLPSSDSSCLLVVDMPENSHDVPFLDVAVGTVTLRAVTTLHECLSPTSCSRLAFHGCIRSSAKSIFLHQTVHGCSGANGLRLSLALFQHEVHHEGTYLSSITTKLRNASAFVTGESFKNVLKQNEHLLHKYLLSSKLKSIKNAACCR